MPITTQTLRIFQPTENILAFYDGRITGQRMFSQDRNWLDDGAFSLGFASYAIVQGTQALVYDTSISIEHAKAVRSELERRGMTSIRVVLSHHHKDHVAGTAAFADCDIIASTKTADALRSSEAAFAKASPAIAPLIHPTEVFDGTTELTVGEIAVQLRPLDVHSFDGLTLYLPDSKTLLAGDTLEDTVTYVAEPDRLEVHLAELDRLSGWDVDNILPNHGAPDRILAGGYTPDFIAATRDYVEKLLACRTNAALTQLSLRDFVADDITTGALSYFAPYEVVHASNLAAVMPT